MINFNRISFCDFADKNSKDIRFFSMLRSWYILHVNLHILYTSADIESEKIRSAFLIGQFILHFEVFFLFLLINQMIHESLCTLLIVHKSIASSNKILNDS